MYSKLKQCIAASCAVLAVSLSMSEAKAAVAADVETGTTTSEETLTPGTIDLDVPAYLVRYLYREPDADSLAMKKWYRGWGMMLYWNPDFLPIHSAYTTQMADRVGASVQGVGFAISKDINKFGSIRLGANFSSVNVGETGSEKAIKRFNVSLDYLWNLSNTYYGYDRHRTDEWLLSVGLKGGRLLNADKSEGSKSDQVGSVNLGLQYRKNIANDMSFFVEPQFAFFSDRWDNTKSFYEIDPGLNLLVGLYFRVGQPKMQIFWEDNKILDNTFFQVFGGSAHSTKVFHFTSLSGKDYNKDHMNFGFNVGSWLNPSLAFRLGYFENIMGTGWSDVKGHETTARQTYRGGRAEFVLNPVTIMTNRTSWHRFGWEMSVGYELGTINKHKPGYNNTWTKSGSESNRNHIDYLAHGVTFGTQFKYYMSRNYAVFLDGRFSNPGYSAEAKDGLNGSGDLNDKIMSWALGMEYYISAFDRYTRFKKFDEHESRSVERLKTKNRWYFELGGGLGQPTHWGENFNTRRSLTGFGAVGMHINDYHGLRLRGYLSRKMLPGVDNKSVTNMIPGDTWTTGVGFDYMYNLTNQWFGVDGNDTRWSDIYLFAGPTMRVVAHELRESFTGNNIFGFEAGMQFTRRISRGVEFFIEPRYEYNVHAAGGDFYQRGNRWNLLAGFKLYQYREKNFHYRDSIARHDKDNWFMELSGGAGFDMTGSTDQFADRMKKFDGDLRMGIGYRINPISSIRANVMYTRYGWGGSDHSGNINGRRGFEGSFDYMANLLNIMYGNNPHRWVQLQGYFGALVNPEDVLESKCTRDIIYDWRFGFEGGLQLIVNPFKNVSLFVEPRGAYFMSDYITKSGAERRKMQRDEHFDLYVGMIIYNQPELLSSRGFKTTDADSTRHWFFEFAGGGALTPSGHKGSTLKNINGIGNVALGHYLSNISSVRFRTSLVPVQNPHLDGYGDKQIMSLSLDYMYNLTNRILGDNPYRRFDASAYIGPVAEFYRSQKPKYNKVWDKGVNVGGQLSWHVNNFVDLFVEERNIMTTEHHTRYEGMAGIKLMQNKDKSLAYQDSAAQHANTWFVEVAGGAGKQFSSDQKVNDGTGKVAVGYRFNPISSLRLVGSGWGRQEYHKHMGRGELSFDYMANLLNLWYGVDPYRRVNLRGYVGPSLVINNFTDAVRNVEFNLGWSTGMQLTAALTYNIDFLLEPRYSQNLTGDEMKSNRMDIYAGLIFYNQPGLLTVRGYNPIHTNNERKWFLEVAGGVGFTPDGRTSGINDHIDALGSLAIGRHFGKSSAMRMRGSLEYIRNMTTTVDKVRWMQEASVEYVHNLTNTFLGVNPYRRWDINLFAGPMAQVGSIDEKSYSVYAGVTGGGQLAWHVNNYIDVFAEPRLSYLFQEEYYARMSGLLGMRFYRNHDANMQYMGNEAAHANTWFLETAAGAGSLVIDQNHPDFTAKLAFGYRFNPVSSVRFGGIGWNRKNPNGSYCRGAEVFADYMASIQNILYGVNPYRRFNLRGFVGGSLRPTSFLSATNTNMVVGMDFGLQGTYHITDNIDFMLEPRYEHYFKTSMQNRVDLYAGLIFYNQRGLLPNKNYEPTDIDDQKTWFIEMSGGMNFSPDGRKRGGILKHINTVMAPALGIHFDNYSSLRGRGSLTIVRNQKDTKEGRHFLPEVSLDYMYNVTNGLMGINPYRRFDVNLFAGPVARMNGLRTGSWSANWGANAGAQASWHINDKWDLVGEGRMLMPFKSGEFYSRLEALAGVAYRFNKNSLEIAKADMLADKTYVQVLLGGQALTMEGLGKFFQYRGMPTFSYNLGYRFNKMIGAQIGSYSNYFGVKSKKGQEDAYTYGLRGEAVANVLNLFSPSYDANESRFNWTASVGVQTGRTRFEDNKTKYGFGLTGASQLQYRVVSQTWALFELRGQAMKAKDGMAVPVTAQLGVMYDFDKTDENNSVASNWFVQSGMGVYESKKCGFEIGGGYDFNPVHSFRLNFAKSGDNFDEAGAWKALTPSYMINLSNLLLGHDDNRRHVDFSVSLGGDLSFVDNPTGKKSYWGLNAGGQISYNINKNWQLYTEPRFMFSGDSKDYIKHNGLDFQTSFGLKYHLPKF